MSASVEMSGERLFVPPNKSGKMHKPSTSQEKYLEASQLFHWATKDHYNIWLYGSAKRSHRTEAVLPRLAKKWENLKTRKRSLFSIDFGKRKIYTCPRRVRKLGRELGIFYKVEHGLGCTECLVRLWRSDTNAMVLGERYFFKCKCIPDIGLKYPNGKMILVEYQSKSSLYANNNIKNKLSRYRTNLWMINERFSASSILLFVIDVPREKVQKLVYNIMPVGLPAFFTDYETFKSVPIGGQLSAQIYIWGEDGKSYPLTDNAKP